MMLISMRVNDYCSNLLEHATRDIDNDDCHDDENIENTDCDDDVDLGECD